jgi:gas vesicle protein
MSDNKDIFLTFVFGGIIGAVFGILYAPKSGKETRCSIKKFGEEIIDTINDLKGDVVDSGRGVYEKGYEKVLAGKNKVSKVFETGKKTFEEYTNRD